jgi:endonuclease/exonuclease/phosphatase family metal-dependent hydrolase
MPPFEPADELRLTVGSYNIHGGVGRDRARDFARIGSVVRSLEVDIIALQEVGGGASGPQGSQGLSGAMVDAAAQLEAATGLTAIRGVTMKKAGDDYGNVILTRFPSRRVARLDLSFGRLEPRGALDVTFDIAGVCLRVIATHLGLLPGERRAQVRRIVEHVRTGAAGDEAVTLLMGDINEWFALGRPLRWLHRCFEGRAHSARTFPARFPIFALDRIWVHPKGVLERYHVCRSPLAREASDHLPITAKLCIAHATLKMAPPAAGPARASSVKG